MNMLKIGTMISSMNVFFIGVEVANQHTQKNVIGT